MTSFQIVESSINGCNHCLLDKPPAAEGVLQLPTRDALHINSKGSLISTESTLEATALQTAPAVCFSSQASSLIGLFKVKTLLSLTAFVAEHHAEE
jgi:hypothetical protein